MKSLVVIVFALVVSAAAAEPKTIFVTGNNHSANEIRKQFAKNYGKKHGKAFFCLAVTNDPGAADYTMAVSEGDVRMGMFGQPPVSVSVTDKNGAVVKTDDSTLSWSKMPYTTSEALCK